MVDYILCLLCIDHDHIKLPTGMYPIPCGLQLYGLILFCKFHFVWPELPVYLLHTLVCAFYTGEADTQRTSCESPSLVFRYNRGMYFEADVSL